MIKTIIADDEKVIRNGLKKLLESSDLPLSISEPAANGKEALNLIKEVLPDIILMDINMPGLKGLDVIAEVKPLIPNTKIIIISGHDDFHYAQRALQLGAFDYLLKPINKEHLFDVIKRAIGTLPQISTLEQSISPAQVDCSSSIGDKAIDYIRANYSNSEINLSNISKMLHISESYLTRIIKQKVNKSFSTYLTDLRMEKAIYILTNRDDVMVGQIAEAVGYSSHHYFCRVFKAYTGLSPLEYKQKNKIL